MHLINLSYEIKYVYNIIANKSDTNILFNACKFISLSLILHVDKFIGLIPYFVTLFKISGNPWTFSEPQKEFKYFLIFFIQWVKRSKSYTIEIRRK